MKNQRRISGQKIEIKTDKVRAFFDQRSQVQSDKNPYVSVIYQDKNPEIAVARDQYEKELITPKLELNCNSNVLDIGCGIGRWADVVLNDINHYIGVDFSESLISKAQERFYNNQGKAIFKVLAAQNLSLDSVGYASYFNRVILSGVLIYLNDTEIIECFRNLVPLLAKESLLYIREPLSLGKRLTLNGFWSEDMEQEYYAIYRSQNELKQLICEGLGVDLPIEFKPLYQNAKFNNRKETSQFYDIVKVSL